MTQRLVSLMETHWVSIDGEFASGGIDLHEVRPDRVLNIIYYWATKNGDREGIAAFDRSLWQPPRGVKALRGPWSSAAESSSLSAFASEVGSQQKMKGPGVKEISDSN